MIKSIKRNISVYIALIILFALYSSFAFSATVEIEVNWTQFSGDNRVSFRDANNELVTTINGGENFICDDVAACFDSSGGAFAQTFTFNDVAPATYNVFLEDSFGDAWNDGGGVASFVRVRVNGVQVVDDDGPPAGAGATETINFTVTDTAGAVATQTCATSLLTGAWTTGASPSATSGSIPVSLGLTAAAASGTWTGFGNDTMNTINAWSDAAVQGNNSLLLSFEWDSTFGAGTDPVYPATSTTGITNSGDGTTGTMTISFGGRTVYNPILHIDRIGGTDGTLSNSGHFEMTAGSLSRLAGPGHFDVFANNTFNRSVYEATAGTESSLNSATGTGAGSVVFNGSYNSVNLSVSGVGPEGLGADVFEMMICVPQADLSLTQSVSDLTPAVGTNITITLVVTNDGPDAANDIRVTDLLPAGLAFDSVPTITQGAYDDSTGIWTVGTLANGGTATLEILAEVTSSSSIVNQATITNSDRADADSDFTVAIGTDDLGDGIADDDETSRTLTPFLSSDIEVDKTDLLGQYTPGESSSYTIRVTNNGPSDAVGVAIVDNLPNGVTLSAVWTCSASSINSSCSALSGGTVGDTVVSLTADIVDNDIITIVIPIEYSANVGDY